MKKDHPAQDGLYEHRPNQITDSVAVSCMEFDEFRVRNRSEVRINQKLYHPDDRAHPDDTNIMEFYPNGVHPPFMLA